MWGDNPRQYKFDSHASICEYHQLNEDKVNKWEVDPVTHGLNVDQINTTNDRMKVQGWLNAFDFDTLWKSGLFDLYLGSLTSVPEGFTMPQSVGGYLDLGSLTSVPEGFTMPQSVGGSLYLCSLTSVPEWIEKKYNVIH